jgi:hypothetical protein
VIPDHTTRETAPAIPNGGAAAAVLAAGLGCFSLALFALLAEAIPALSRFFNFYNPTGPLSGVTTTAVALWLILWVVLSRIWSGKTLPFGKITGIAFLLLALGLLLSFPPFADFLQGK